MPGSSPTIERRLFVSRLKRVDLPTLGRPTIATSGSASAPGRVGMTDLRYVGTGISCSRSGINRPQPTVPHKWLFKSTVPARLRTGGIHCSRWTHYDGKSTRQLDGLLRNLNA